VTSPRPVRIQEEDFDITAELAALKGSSRTIGGVVAFIGVVRDFSRGREVSKLFFEYFPGMAEEKLGALREEAIERFDLVELHLVHRHGTLFPGDNIVLILSASRHREAAFKSAAWCIEELKKRVPIWKKEYGAGGEEWIEEGPQP
jgi:molybdopterin synthase catalytic subunit